MLTYRETIQAALTIYNLNKAEAGDNNAYNLMIATIVTVATKGDINAVKDANLLPVIKACIPPAQLPGVLARFN